MTSEELLQLVTEQYLQSRDFNGLSITNLLANGYDANEMQNLARQLIKENKISVVSGKRDSNPHIKRLPTEELASQLRQIDEEFGSIVLYPTPEHLLGVVNEDNYGNRPFTLRLALGEPQLSYQSFDLSVLEHYRNDPRYHYDFHDVQGRICIKDEHYLSDSMAERDKVLLQSFGLSYDKDLNGAVAVFLRYLASLSPEHQQIWNSKRLSREDTLHPDYYRSSIQGEWPEYISMYQGIVEEQHLINEMSKLMGREPLFRNEYNGNKRPREFGSLLRPTLRELNSFILLLDQMVSDNINKKFFQNDIPLTSDIDLGDDRVEVRQKGTLTLLDEWVTAKYSEATLINEMLQPFKEVRKLRQKPAHSIREDDFDEKYVREQRELVVRVWRAMQSLRLAFSSHPNCKSLKAPDYLDRVWTL